MTITIGRAIRMALFIIGRWTIHLVGEGPMVFCCSGHRRRPVRSGFTDTLAALGVVTAVGSAMAVGRGISGVGAKVGAEGRAAQLHIHIHMRAKVGAEGRAAQRHIHMKRLAVFTRRSFTPAQLHMKRPCVKRPCRRRGRRTSHSLLTASSVSSSIRLEGQPSRLAWQRARPAMIAATTRAATTRAATTRSPLALGRRPPLRL